MMLEDGGTYAKVIADSIGPTGDRVTTFEIRFHRFVLAELNTHCLFARNSASSRAIPVRKQLEQYRSNTAWPAVWAAEKKGMAGGDHLAGQDLERAVTLFKSVNRVTYNLVSRYVDQNPDAEHRLHKSVLNRLLEPMLWHTAVVTAASFGNFFDQRTAPAAQPELRLVAKLMFELYQAHEPARLERGQWHLPYLHDDERAGPGEDGTRGCFLYLKGTDGWQDTGQDAREISSARCARVSYLSQDGRRDIVEDLCLYTDLVKNWHWSPLEHVCTPWPNNLQHVPILDPDSGWRIADRRLARMGKFPGWQQWRHAVEGRQGYTSQR
jgi:hypothetical protein